MWKVWFGGMADRRILHDYDPVVFSIRSDKVPFLFE